MRKPLRIPPNSFAFTVILGLFAALPPLSIDISAPTLALLPDALSTTRAIAGLTLSLFMAGFALGQLGGGALSDRYGRRPILLGGLCVFTLAGGACVLARSGEALLALRFVQGFGAGACSVISFAIIQDLFEGEAARVKRAYVTVIFGAVPMLAPALGAILTSWLGWRSVHWTLALAGLILLGITLIFIEESKPPGRNAAPPPGQTTVTLLWRDTRFVRLVLVNALSYGGIFAYISGSPFVIIGQLAHSPRVFAAVFACTAASLSLGVWTSGRLSRRGVSAAALINPALFISMGACFLMMAIRFMEMGTEFVLLPFLLVVLFARGIVAPNIQHLAIARHPDRAGIASAVVGVSQLLLGALASAAVAALLISHGAGAIAATMSVLATGAAAVWVLSGQTK